MPRKIKQLSNLEVSRIRSNLSRKATAIGERLQNNAVGILTDNDGNPIEMSASQIKSAELVLRHILPGQQATTFTDLTVIEKSKDQIEAEYQTALANLPLQDLTEVLKGIPQEERQALVDSLEETQQ